MRACIHRGSKQIGGSCIEVESLGRRLLVDFGLPLDAGENHGQYVPAIAASFDRLTANPPQNIDALLLEGSSLGRIPDHQQFPTEKENEARLVQVFSATEGVMPIHTSAQNIDRVVSIFKASQQTGRKLIIDLYTAAILEATGNERTVSFF